MAFCSGCGEKIEDEVQFCSKCGKGVGGVPADNKRQGKNTLLLVSFIIGILFLITNGIVLIVPVFSAPGSLNKIISIKGNGNFTTSEKFVSAFEKINIVGSAEVRFYASQEYRTIITVDSNLLEYTEIDIRGNTLSIGSKRGNYSFTKYLVDVYCPIINSVSISGSGCFDGMNNINTKAFTANISGSGRIECTIESEAFYAKISGSGNITATGTSRDSDISIPGSGNFYGNKFTVNNATVRINGSGKVNINVSEHLKANIPGSGKINYYGNPKIDSKISGSGQLIKM